MFVTVYAASGGLAAAKCDSFVYSLAAGRRVIYKFELLEIH